MGVGLQPLEFRDCLTDSPAFREKLQAHEKELERTSQQIKGLVKEVKDLLNAARSLSKAQRTLSNSLQKFNLECIGTTQTDDELVISESLKEFGHLISNIEDQRDMMLDRAYDQFILPLENFRKEHIGGVKEGKKKFEKQTAKFCMSQERYLNLSTKKQDAVLKEADAALAMEQRYFHQASTQYVFLLQEVQERKKFEFVETLLGFMYSWLTFYHNGHEAANEFKHYMQDLQYRLQKTRENFNATRDQTKNYMDKILEKSDSEGPNKTNMREGYLFLLEKKAFGTTWTKHYCTYNKDTKEFRMTLFNQVIGKSNPAESITLASCVRRMSDSIEKRFCFDITSVDKPGAPGVLYTFQALSEEDRKQWMDIMDGKEPTYAMPGKISKPEGRTLDDIGINFVARCIEVIESRGLEELGLYRVGGVSSKVSKLVSMGLDRRKSDKLLQLEDSYEWDSKTITSALKTYLRNLQEPLMTFRFHNAFIAATKQETRALRVNDVHTLVHRLPQQNRECLDILIRHLKNVAAKSDKNLMTVSNLGVCFGPTLLRAEEETVAAIMDIKFCNIVVEILIENYDKIFKGPPDPSDSARSESARPDPVPSRRDSGRQEPRSSPQSVGMPTQQNHVQPGPHMMHVRPVKYLYPQGPPPITHAVTKSYEGPTPVSLSSSLHNVAMIRERDGNGVGYYSRDHINNYGPSMVSSLGYQGNHKMSHIVSRAMPAFSESNLSSVGSHQTYSPHHTNKHRALFFHGNGGNMERSSDMYSNSSSNESVSSLPSKDSLNHNNYTTATPQKSKRGAFAGIHHASVYKTQDFSGVQSTSSSASGRSSPATPVARSVRTLYVCLGENDGELSFEPNQIITNVRPSKEPGWLEGTLNGKTGLVPENYVEPLH